MNSADTFGGAEEVLRALTAGFAPDPSLDGLAIGRPAPGSVLAGIRGRTVSHGSHSFHESCDGCPSPRRPARRVVFMKAAQVGPPRQATTGSAFACTGRWGRCGRSSQPWIWPSVYRNATADRSADRGKHVQGPSRLRIKSSPPQFPRHRQIPDVTRSIATQRRCQNCRIKKTSAFFSGLQNRFWQIDRPDLDSGWRRSCRLKRDKTKKLGQFRRFLSSPDLI